MTGAVSSKRPLLLRLALIAVVSLVPRVAMVAAIQTQPLSDFAFYFDTARQLAERGHMHGIPAMFPPGYPLILAAGMALIRGVDTLLVAKLVNCVLAAASVFFSGLFGARLAGAKAGVLAATLCAIYPRSIAGVNLIASENLFNPLLLVLLLLITATVRKERVIKDGALAGALIAALALTRTVAYFFGAIWFVIAMIARRKWTAALMELLLLLAVQHAVMLPWALRNRADVGKFTFLTTGAGMALFAGNNDHADGRWYPWQDDLGRIRSINGLSTAELDRIAGEEARRWMRQHPTAAVKLFFRRLWIIAREDTLAAAWVLNGRTQPRWPFIAVRAGGAVVGVLGFLGILRLLGGVRDRAGAAVAAAVILIPAYLLATTALVAVNGRYRWPVEDLLVPLAAVAVVRRPATA